MPLLKPNSKNNEKEVKNIINKNVASSMITQPSFVKILESNGCPTLKIGSVARKIRKQLLDEAKNGDLTADDVMPRAYYLVGEYLSISDVKTVDEIAVEGSASKIDSIRQNGFNATLPYTGSGLTLGMAGRNSFGGANYYSTRFGEGQTEWKNSKVFFVENGLRIDETEQFIHYKQVDYVDYSQKSDRKGLFAFKRNGITFVMKNGEQIIMRVMADDLDAIRYWIEKDMKNTDVISNNNGGNDDLLVKYFDMFEKGLITQEEFNLKKEELLYGDDSFSNTESASAMYCSNCGNLIEDDSNFCSKCGNKLK